VDAFSNSPPSSRSFVTGTVTIFNRNNYRLYFDNTNGKAYFFMHGTDQTFGDSTFPVTRDPGSLIGVAVMSNPAWKKAYREHVEKIYQEVLKPIDWAARVTEVGEKVKADLAKVNEKMAKDYEPRIAKPQPRTGRIANVAKQLGILAATQTRPRRHRSRLSLRQDGVSP